MIFIFWIKKIIIRTLFIVFLWASSNQRILIFQVSELYDKRTSHSSFQNWNPAYCCNNSKYRIRSEDLKNSINNYFKIGMIVDSEIDRGELMLHQSISLDCIIGKHEIQAEKEGSYESYLTLIEVWLMKQIMISHQSFWT